MKKHYPALYYILAFLCLPVVCVIIDKLEYQKIVSLDMFKWTTVLVTVSGIIGLCSPHKKPVDWPLMILMPLSLAAAYFCVGLLDDVYGTEMGYFDLSHGFYIMTHQPLWLYVMATLPALLTSFLCKYIKTQWLRFALIGLLVLAMVLAVLPFGIRYYSAKAVSSYFEERGLYTSLYTVQDITEKGLFTTHHSSEFKKCTEGATTAENIHTLYGKPHACVGSGIVRDIYFTTDGYLISVRYNWDTVYRIEKVKI